MGRSVGGFIGIEGEWNECIAGVRTNILVGVGGCVFV
ncbi:MgtC/SapB family protein, partial [Bacillus thuringiensis]